MGSGKVGLDAMIAFPKRGFQSYPIQLVCFKLGPSLWGLVTCLLYYIYIYIYIHGDGLTPKLS